MIKYIDEYQIQNKQILLKADFNVALNPDFTISDDAKIKQTLPTIKKLLQDNNKLIITSHLGRPKNREENYSLAKIAKRLEKYLPNYKISLIKNFLTEPKDTFQNQEPKEIFILENIRFWQQEKANEKYFGQKLASLVDVFVNDAFAVSHRAHASVVGPPQFIPSYGGLLLKKEVQMLAKGTNNPQKPMAAIMGGVKISTKINLLERLINIADYVIVGGALANNFLVAQGYKVGKSFFEKECVKKAKELIALAKLKDKKILLPVDVVVGDMEDFEKEGVTRDLVEIEENDNILDIGPKTRELFSQAIAASKTIIWNGPVGYNENPQFRRGTDAVYGAIVKNQEAISLLGGGDTLAALSGKPDLDKVTHVSTGGGAMLEFIENGTLPGIEALDSDL